jgi:hypothetical protein
MRAHYLRRRHTLPLSFVAPPYRDPPQERWAMLQRYDATAYRHERSRCRQHHVRHTPAVPGGDRSPGPINLTQSLELLWRRSHGQAMHGRVAPADPEVVDRPHVGPPELKDQEHLGSPAADSAHTRQPRDDLVVGERVDPV